MCYSELQHYCTCKSFFDFLCPRRHPLPTFVKAGRVYHSLGRQAVGPGTEGNRFYVGYANGKNAGDADRYALLAGFAFYVLNQVRKPTKWVGRLFLWIMNSSHSGVTDWGLKHVRIERDFKILMRVAAAADD